EELWQLLGKKTSIFNQMWLKYDPEAIKEQEITIPIQINGKLKGTISVAVDCPEEEIKNLAIKEIENKIKDKQVKKVILVPKKLVNVVVG
ncbi:MAG: class I tRNA ligase family protein, partial [bacterium]